jgi:predicted small secreted protein
MNIKLSSNRSRMIMALVLAAAACALSACQTVKGLGSDISYAGEKTEKAIQNSGK